VAEYPIFQVAFQVAGHGFGLAERGGEPD
jgi:hypothetical protein